MNLKWHSSSRTSLLSVGLVLATVVACQPSPVSTETHLTQGDTAHDVSLNGQSRHAVIFDDILMLNLEAISLPPRFPDQASSHTNIRGYLLSARLTDEDPTGDSRTLVGPLYKLDGPVSSMANSAGVTFSDEDRSALAQKPRLSFREPGELVKSVVVDGRKNWHDYVLEIDGDEATWRDLGKRAILPLLGWPHPDYFESRSRRVAVQKERDGKVRIYDLQTSKPISDPWLEAVSASYLSREDLGNGVIHLTDDLNYLVVFLRSANRIEQPGEDRLIFDFTMDGKTMRRENHFLVYERPNPDPKVYEGTDFRTHPVVLEGELLLLKELDDRIEFQTLGDRVMFSHRFTPEEEWMADVLTRVEYDERGNRVVFTAKPLEFTTFGDRGEGTIRVAMWDYINDRVVQYSLPVADLFELKSDGYYPKNVIPITTQ